MPGVRITPLHPSLGAEVEGIDLSAPIDEPTRHALRFAGVGQADDNPRARPAVLARVPLRAGQGGHHPAHCLGV